MSGDQCVPHHHAGQYTATLSLLAYPGGQVCWYPSGYHYPHRARLSNHLTTCPIAGFQRLSSLIALRTHGAPPSSSR